MCKFCHYTNLQPLWAEDNLKKKSEIFGVYHLLDTARKYDQPKYFFLKDFKKI